MNDFYRQATSLGLSGLDLIDYVDACEKKFHAQSDLEVLSRKLDTILDQKRMLEKRVRRYSLVIEEYKPHNIDFVDVSKNSNRS